MRLKILILIVFVLTFITACQSNDVIENNENLVTSEIQLSVYEDFGREKVFEEAIPYKETMTVMDALEDHLEIGTEYGGSFVKSIEGIASEYDKKNGSKKKDWFYYVNGYLAKVGAGEYILEEDEHILWDFHSWEKGMSPQNIVGAFPQSFVNPYGEYNMTIEICGDDTYGNQMEALKAYLEKEIIKASTEITVEVKSYEDARLTDTNVQTILLGTSNRIVENETIKNFMDHKSKIGIYFDYMDGEIIVNDWQYNVVNQYKQGSVIGVLPKEHGHPACSWLLVGTDGNEVKKAVDLLINSSERIRNKFSVVIVNDEVIDVPVRE